jgi:iron(III) transport system permease protein
MAGVVAVVVLALLPHLAVALTSVQHRWTGTVLPSEYTARWYREVFTHPISAVSIRNSLFLSLSSSMLDVILGVGLAVVLVRRRFPGAAVLDGLAMMPLAVPGLVLAFGYVACYTGAPVLDPRANPVALLIIAYAVRRLPFMLRSVAAGLQQTNVALEEASLNLGATPAQTLARVTVPLVLANIIAGAVLTFSFAMLEVSDSLILAFNPRYYPITKAIYTLNNRLADGPFIASAMGVLAMVLLAATLLGAGALMGRRLGEIFRA